MTPFRRMPVRYALIGLFISVLPSSVPVKAQAASVRNSQHRSTDFDDLLTLRTFSDLAVSSDGRWAAFVRSAPFNSPSVKRTDSITFLDLHTRISYAVAVDGAPRQLQWSPSGDTLAYLAGSSGKTRVWLCAPRGQAARPLTMRDSLAGQLVSFSWSPTGKALAYLAAEPTDGSAARDSVRVTPRLVIFRDSPESFTGPLSPSYRSDSTGAYLATVGIISGGSAEVLARHLVASKYDPEVGWSSGSILVAGAPLPASWWSQITKRTIHLFDPKRSSERALPRQDVETWRPSRSPSGQQVAYIAYQVFPDDDRQMQRTVLQVLDLNGGAQPRTLSHENDGLLLGHTPIWAGDSALYITRYEKGSARLFLVNVVTRRWRALTPDTLSVAAFAISNDEKTIVAVMESANVPQELYGIDPTTGDLSRLTKYADALRLPPRGRIKELTWPSSDGRFTVHGFLVEPPGYDSTRAYPLVVLVNGGPGALFTNAFIDANYWRQALIPPQWLAAAGYLVLLPNPRGVGSYGEEYAALRGDHAFGPLSDIESGVSALVAHGMVDSTKMGIAGTSYGGYLTALAITRTTRFAAASIDDGPTDLRLDYGVNYAFHATWFRMMYGGTPWEMPEAYAAESPITYVARVSTPVLMRYGGRGSTSDEIRPSYMLAQGLEFYAGLRDAGVPVEFILHPGQGHGAVDWELYKDWVTRNVRWFDYWLLKKGERPPATLP